MAVWKENIFHSNYDYSFNKQLDAHIALLHKQCRRE